ncbi:MAG: hypothetical protein R3F59_29725 [Myxococcota bacterium]
MKRRFARHAKAVARAGGPPVRRGGWMGLADAVAHLGGRFEGRPHSALADATNAAWVLRAVGADPGLPGAGAPRT